MQDSVKSIVIDNIAVKRMTDTSEIERIAHWMHSWWGEKEGYSLEAVRENMAHSLNETGLPQTYGLYLSGVLIGMYQFRNEDLFVRPDIYPWLANVFIEPEYRGRGLGSFLISSVRENARAAGLSELHLFTTHEGLYERFGWEFIGGIDTFLEPRMQRLYRLGIK